MHNLLSWGLSTATPSTTTAAPTTTTAAPTTTTAAPTTTTEPLTTTAATEEPIPCLTCPKGTERIQTCANGFQGECQECPDGSYNDEVTGSSLNRQRRLILCETTSTDASVAEFEICRLHSECAAGSEIAEYGSLSSDQECRPCAESEFSSETNGQCERCVECNAPQSYERSCSKTANAICKIATLGEGAGLGTTDSLFIHYVAFKIEIRKGESHFFAFMQETALR